MQFKEIKFKLLILHLEYENISHKTRILSTAIKYFRFYSSLIVFNENLTEQSGHGTLLIKYAVYVYLAPSLRLSIYTIFFGIQKERRRLRICKRNHYCIVQISCSKLNSMDEYRQIFPKNVKKPHIIDRIFFKTITTQQSDINNLQIHILNEAIKPLLYRYRIRN